MRHFGKIAVWLAGGLALNASLYVCSGAARSNPYEPIVTRNVFNLNPPKPITTTKQNEPPSKITPDGIMTIFGSRQVLFKVAVPPHPPKPATEKHYILSEGQGQDGIEVKHIDEKTGMITFDNHGVVQRIPLVKAKPITTPTPVVMRSRHAPPHGAPAAQHVPPSIANRLNQLRQNRNYRQHFGNDNGSDNNASFGTAGSSYRSTSAQSQKKLTPEEQMIMIAAQHAHAQQTGDPTAPLYPPTPLDKAAGVVTEHGSSSSSSSPPTPP